MPQQFHEIGQFDFLYIGKLWKFLVINQKRSTADSCIVYSLTMWCLCDSADLKTHIVLTAQYIRGTKVSISNAFAYISIGIY